MTLLFVEKAWNEGAQQRDDHGRFAGTTGGSGGGGSAGAGAALSADDKEGVGIIKDHLTMIDSSYGVPGGLKTTPERLILEHGQAFPTNADTYKGKRGTPHRCFENSAKHALQNPDLDLTYVEGYMTVSGVPLKHAWTVDRKGFVIDPTITAGAAKGYFGVPFTKEYVHNTAMRTKYWGIISMQTNRDMFRQGPPPHAFEKVGE